MVCEMVLRLLSSCSHPAHESCCDARDMYGVGGGGKEPYFKSVSESIRHISNSCTKGAYFDLNKVNMIDAQSRRSPSNLSNTNPHLFCLEDLENLGCADECRYKIFMQGL